MQFPIQVPVLSPEQTPPQVEVAFRAVAYCRSLTDPQSVGLPPSTRQSRSLTPMELGVESAALNVIRNYLNGEMTFREYTAMVEPSSDDAPVSELLLPRRRNKKIAKPTPADDAGSAEEAGK
jgi:hypothetical protein